MTAPVYIRINGTDYILNDVNEIRLREKLQEKFDPDQEVEEWVDGKYSTTLELQDLFNVKKKVKPLVDCSCMVCNKEFKGEEPKMCCSGRDCGCMGMPTEPIVCSKECYDKLMNRSC